MKILKYIHAVICIILLAQTVSAQIVKIDMDPSVLLPNDIADCKLTLAVPRETYVRGITFFAPSGIEVDPSSVTGIGWLSPGINYELPFTIKAKESGIYTIPIYINTLNGTIKQIMIVRVEDRMPKIVLDKTTFYLNEVNDVSFTISSPIQISNVIVEPLFESNPKVIYVENGKGSFRFKPKTAEPLKFKLAFYNGRNYHEVIQTIDATYLESKGVLINATPQYPVVLIGDVIDIDVEVANLRNDDVFSVKIEALDGEFSKKSFEIPMIKAGEKKSVTFKWSPKSAGMKDITLKIEYTDEFNERYSEIEKISVKVLNKTVLAISNVEVERDAGRITITGDVSNNGRSKIYNIFLEAFADGESKTFYISSLDPSDFDSFEFLLNTNASFVTIKASWNNEIGEKFEETYEIKIPSTRIVFEERTDNTVLIVGVVVFVVVVALVAIIWKRSR